MGPCHFWKNTIVGNFVTVLFGFIALIWKMYLKHLRGKSQVCQDQIHNRKINQELKGENENNYQKFLHKVLHWIIIKPNSITVSRT